eukprot:6164881-Amphidinium_carterae.1
MDQKTKLRKRLVREIPCCDCLSVLRAVLRTSSEDQQESWDLPMRDHSNELGEDRKRIRAALDACWAGPACNCFQQVCQQRCQRGHVGVPSPAHCQGTSGPA